MRRVDCSMAKMPDTRFAILRDAVVCSWETFVARTKEHDVDSALTEVYLGNYTDMGDDITVTRWGVNLITGPTLPGKTSFERTFVDELLAAFPDPDVLKNVFYDSCADVVAVEYIDGVAIVVKF